MAVPESLLCKQIGGIHVISSVALTKLQMPETIRGKNAPAERVRKANAMFLTFAERGNTRAMRNALEFGASITCCDEEGRTGLMLACYAKSKDGVLLILETMQKMGMTGPEITEYVNKRGGALNKTSALGHINTITARSDPNAMEIIGILRGFDARM